MGILRVLVIAIYWLGQLEFVCDEVYVFVIVGYIVIIVKLFDWTN